MAKELKINSIHIDPLFELGARIFVHSHDTAYTYCTIQRPTDAVKRYLVDNEIVYTINLQVSITGETILCYTAEKSVRIKNTLKLPKFFKTHRCGQINDYGITTI